MRQKKCKGYIPEEILNERHDPKVFNEAMNRLCTLIRENKNMNIL